MKEKEESGALQRFNKVLLIVVPLISISVIVLDANKLIPWKSYPKITSIAEYEFLDFTVKRKFDEKGIVVLNDSVSVYGFFVSDKGGRVFENMRPVFQLYKPNKDSIFYTIQNNDTLRFDIRLKED